MAENDLSRRRFLTIIAAASPTILVGDVSAFASDVRTWNGTVLGAESQLVFDGLPEQQTRRVVAQVLGEVERLEQIFSLYRSDSELSRLNETGELRNPSHDMQVLLACALGFWRKTDGAFNPAIQPLWQALNTHFAKSPDEEPPAENIRKAAGLCDPEGISIDRGAIKLSPGMALTFNGIAQGYITDQVTGLLQQAGLRHVLINLGEMRALPGRGWDVGLGGGGQIHLASRALATSAPAGTTFSADGKWHHLIDPVTGNSARDVRQVSVVAGDATTADALSTALAVHGGAVKSIAARFPNVGIRTVISDGRVETAGSLV